MFNYIGKPNAHAHPFASTECKLAAIYPRKGMEAEPRIELGHIGFANRCITTLLLGHGVRATPLAAHARMVKQLRQLRAHGFGQGGF